MAMNFESKAHERVSWCACHQTLRFGLIFCQRMPWYDGLRNSKATKMQVIANEAKKVWLQEGAPLSADAVERTTKAPAQISSLGRAIRTILQNRKKWPTVKAIANPRGASIRYDQPAPTAPNSTTMQSSAERRKPGLNWQELCIVGVLKD